MCYGFGRKINTTWRHGIPPKMNETQGRISIKCCFFVIKMNNIRNNVVALGFFGITRSLKFTIDSIKHNITDSLNELGYDFKIFLHTYALDSYNNVRTGESTTQIDNDEYKLLNPDYFVIENQDEVKKNLNLEQYRKYPDPWNTQYDSVDNFILAQYSKMKLTKMIKDTKTKFDYIIFLRPDVEYLNKLEESFSSLYLIVEYVYLILMLNMKSHGFGSLMIDSITNYNNYRIYGELFHKLLSISKFMSLHSETVMARYLLDNKVYYKHIMFRFRRIRINGNISPYDKHINV